MKFTCNRAALDQAVSTVSAVVSSRTPREILKCARLTARSDQVTITGTDLEVGVRFEVTQVEVKEEGDVLVHAETLGQIVRELTDETLSLEIDQGTIKIRGEGSFFQIFAQDAAEFPPVPEFEGEPTLVIEVDRLKHLIELTVFAAARENTRYAINGVFWDKKGKKLQLVATDGRRLARAVGSVQGEAEESMAVIVPPKTMSLLARVIQSGVGEEARIRVTPNQFLVGIGPVTLSSILVEGHFPRHEDVIPKDNPIHVEFDTAELHSAIRRAALLTNDESKGIRMEFSAEGLVLSSRAPEEGEATVRMGIQYSGTAITVGFNPTFLTDALRVVGTEKVTLELSDPARPGVLTVGKDYTYVIMPVSLA